MEIKRKGGVWGLYFRSRVHQPMDITVRIKGVQKKGPKWAHDKDLEFKINLEVTDKLIGKRKAPRMKKTEVINR